MAILSKLLLPIIIGNYIYEQNRSRKFYEQQSAQQRAEEAAREELRGRNLEDMHDRDLAAIFAKQGLTDSERGTLINDLFRQREQARYDADLRGVQHREDTAIQRAMRDWTAAGMNPAAFRSQMAGSSGGQVASARAHALDREIQQEDYEQRQRDQENQNMMQLLMMLALITRSDVRAQTGDRHYHTNVNVPRKI